MSVFVDASVFVAILTREDDADTFLDRLDGVNDAITSPIAAANAVSLSKAAPLPSREAS